MKMSWMCFVTATVLVVFGCRRVQGGDENGSEAALPTDTVDEESGGPSGETETALAPGLETDDSGDTSSEIEDTETDVRDTATQVESTDSETGEPDTETGSAPDTASEPDAGIDLDSASDSATETDCPEGFQAENGACVDLDECAVGAHLCDPFAFCINTPGGHACECFEGYIEDGAACVFEDECWGDDECDHDRICSVEPEGRRCIHASCSPQKVATLGGSPMDTVVRNGVAYVLLSVGGLLTYDVTLPERPRLLGHLAVPGGKAVEIQVVEDLAYIRVQKGIRAGAVVIADISDPETPVVLSLIPGPSNGFDATDNYLYVVDDATLVIADVSAPAEPIVVGVHSLARRSHGITVVESLAYVASSDSGEGSWLTIFDVSTPAAVDAMGEVQVTASRYLSGDIVVNGTTVYVARSRDGLLIVVDAENPWEPSLVDTIEIAAADDVRMVFELSMVDDRLYLSFSYFDYVDALELAAYDVSVPNAPAQIGTTSDLELSGRVSLDGHTAYVAQPDGVLILDLAELTFTQIQGMFNPLGDIGRVVLHGDVLYLGNRERLHLVDVSDEMNPRMLTDMALDVNDIRASDGFVYVAGDAGLHCVDARDPMNPRIAGELPLEGGIGRLALSGNRAYLGSGDAETGYHFRLLDIADPAAPALLGSLALDQPITTIDAFGDLVYASSGTAFLVIDASTPASPVVVGQLEAGVFYDLFAQGQRVFLSTGRNGESFVVNAGIPSRPVLEASSLDTTLNFMEPGLESVYAIDNTLYAISGNRVVVYDISDLSEPRRTATISPSTASQFTGIVVRDGFAFCPDRQNGLHVFDVSARRNAKVSGTVKVERHASGGMAVKEGVLFGGIYEDNGRSWVSIDVHDPAAPIRLDAVTHSDSLQRDLVIQGDTAYALLDDALAIIDVSEPDRLAIISDVPLPESFSADGLAVSGTLAYVAGDTAATKDRSRLLVFDVSQPALPLLLSDNGAMTDSASDIAVADGFAYVATEQGLSVFSLEVPSMPVPVAEALADDMHSERRVLLSEASDNRAYVTLVDGLMIIDVQAPAAPEVESVLSVPDCTATDVALLGQTAYVACAAGVAVVDISDTAHPRYLHHIHTPDGAARIAADENAVYSSGMDITIIAPDGCHHLQ